MKFSAFTVLAIAAVAFSQCTSQTDQKKAAEAARHNSALECYNQALAALEAGDAVQCLQLLDSIKNTYGSDAAVMDSVLNLYPRATVVNAENQLVATELSVSTVETQLDSLKALMVHVDVPGTPGYDEARSSHNANFESATGISGRIDENADFKLITNVAGNVGHESITIFTADDSIDSDTIPISSERNFIHGGYERITFMYDESDPLGAFIVDNRNKEIKVTFNGKNPRTITLTAKQVDGIATAHLYSEVAAEFRRLVLNRQRLNRHIEVARNEDKL